MGKWVGEKFKSNFAIGDPEWWGKTLAYSRPLIILVIILSIFFGIRTFFNAGDRTINKVKVASGATANITYIQQPRLYQGVYGKLASDRATVGVFKEVTPQIDISIGAGIDYDSDPVVEAEVRFKF